MTFVDMILITVALTISMIVSSVTTYWVLMKVFSSDYWIFKMKRWGKKVGEELIDDFKKD